MGKNSSSEKNSKYFKTFGVLNQQEFTRNKQIVEIFVKQILEVNK